MSVTLDTSYPTNHTPCGIPSRNKVAFKPLITVRFVTIFFAADIMAYPFLLLEHCCATFINSTGDIKNDCKTPIKKLMIVQIKENSM